MRIAIVNDLRLAVETLRRSVDLIPGASVAWIAMDGAQAVEACARDVPDIIFMDMIMPVMDGVEATRRIMKATPCPILVVTATVEGNASRVYEALGAGALDAVATPRLGPDGRLADAEALVRKVESIAAIAGPSTSARPIAGGAPARASDTERHSAGVATPMVVIGASTGGPSALSVLLRALPRPVPWPVAVVQHIDVDFAPGLADWLARDTGQNVVVVRDGDAPTAGRVELSCSHDHLVLDSSGRYRYTVEPRDAIHRPSIDVFFESIVRRRPSPGVAVVLTGMGRDGAAGLARLREIGWHTIAQDQATSVVWGMPAACVELGAAIETLPIARIGEAIVARMHPTPPRTAHDAKSTGSHNTPSGPRSA